MSHCNLVDAIIEDHHDGRGKVENPPCGQNGVAKLLVDDTFVRNLKLGVSPGKHADDAWDASQDPHTENGDPDSGRVENSHVLNWISAILAECR